MILARLFRASILQRTSTLSRHLRRVRGILTISFFCDQSFDDDTQIASVQLFGPLENMTSTRVGSGASSLIADISNVDRDNDETLLVDVPVMIYRSGNEMWLTDSSFQEIPTMAPMLSDARSKKAERT